MESCLNLKPERVGSVVVEDLKKDLFSDFSRISASQDPVLLEKEHLHVYLRIRPFTAAESDLGESQECVTIEAQDTVVLKAPRTSLTSRQSERWGPQTAQRFQFSQVYGPETTQREMFDGTTKRLVKDVLKGENSVVFTYGVTNAGKTFTFLGPESDGGILPRSLNVIFNSIEGRVYAHNNIKPHRCIDFTRLTKDQQDEEATNKRNLLRRFKENDSQKSSASLSGKTLLEGSLSSDLDGQVGADSFCLDEDPHVKFSVWVSFCEIYNENIHDLLEVLPNSSQRRTVLRLSQDIKGNSFIKDLKWIQVNDADEAYKVMKIGRKSQSFSSTKLNYVSSRSHSIFSIRILRIEDVGVPRVQTISELSLCDLAGSERCAKTQNKGDRLKEAGNINTSLLTLGKCINALRLNQTQSKFQQHIPFRESKLTHYLQGFFCGRGKACMIVNINQCASMFDETLNVLKFSAVAQKVVVLNPKPTLILPKRSARDVSFLINNADRKEWDKRNSSLLGWEMSLEDVQEGEDDEDDEEMEEEDDESYVESMEEDTVLEAEESHHLCEEQIKELREELSREQSEKLALESRIREEVTTEFMELFSKMEGDYNERIKRETEIIEERAERRLEILKNLVNRNGSNTSCTEDSAKGSHVELLTGVIEAMQDDLVKIKRDAEAAQTCLASSGESPGTVGGLRAQLEEMAEELLRGQQLANAKTKEMEMMHVQCQQTSERLQETQKSYESQMVKCQELMAICQEKDDMISTLQTALDQNVEAATKDRALIDSIKEEILELRNNCKCLRDGEHSTGEQPESAEMQELRQELKCQDASLAELRSKLCSLEHAREEALSSLEKERTDTGRLAGENRSLARELRLLQLAVDDASSKLQTAEVELARQTDVSAEFAEKLRKAEASLGERGVEASEQKETMESMAREVEHLRKKLTKPESSPRTQRGSSSFRGTMEALQEECEKMVAASQERSRRVEELEQELGRAREEIRGLEELCRQTRSGQQEEQEVLREQLKRQQETLAAREAQIAALQENLQEAQNKLCQAQEESQCSRGAVEEEEKGRREAEERLTQRGAELERKAHQLLESRELCEDGLDQIKSLSLDLQEKEREISHLKDKLTDCGAEMEQMQREIMSVNQENKSLQLKLCESEWMKNEALNGKEQTIHQLRTVQGSDAKSVEPPRQDRQRAHQDLLAKESIMEDVRLELTQTHQEERTSEQQLEVEAPPEETGALSEELCENFAERADLKDGRRGGGGGGGHPERASVAPLPGPSRATLHEQRTPASTAEAEDGLRKESAEGGDLVTALRSEMECFRNSRKKVKAKGNLHGDSSSPTLEAQQMSVLDSSVVSTESGRQLRFPKPELEIQFSPLKPDRLAIRTPGQDTSFTVKISRTARKRKSTDMEGSVESENRKNTRFRGNSRVNMFSSESPPVLGNKAHRLNLQGSSASLKNRKDGTLQKIGDFIQSSPALLGSKAKKVIGIVTAKSPGREPVARPKRSKRKLHKTQISSPLDIPSHPIIGADQDDKESDHLIIKRNLRTRPAKK